MKAKRRNTDRAAWVFMPFSKTSNFDLAEGYVNNGLVNSLGEIYIELTPEQQYEKDKILSSPSQKSSNFWKNLPLSRVNAP